MALNQPLCSLLINSSIKRNHLNKVTFISFVIRNKKQLALFLPYLLLIINPIVSFAQKPKDKRDTSDFYYRLEKKADKHEFTSWIYDVVFEDMNTSDSIVPTEFKKKKTANPFLKYKGKIIRKVDVIVLDPFGYSVNDFYGKSPDYVEKLGNKYHVTTKEQIIRNLLLFKPNKPVDVLELSESERLLRLSPYTFDARIYIQKTLAKSSDSIDILVVTQDRWTASATSTFDLSVPDVILTDKNILGFGHQYEQGFAWNFNDQMITTSGRYSIFNIKKTFISAALFYATTKDHNQLGVTIERLFFSPLAKWAGGLSIIRNNTVYKQFYYDPNITNKYTLNYNTLDFWGAKSFPLVQNKEASIDRRSSNYIIGARYFKTAYFERPSFTIDTDQVNRDQSLYLANFGFSQRKYYRDRYLFRYGANEDIPQGNVFEIVVGALQKERADLRYYSGIKYGTGKHIYDFGYISFGAGYGTFYNAHYIGTGVVNIESFYFTDLIKKNRWYFRQFARFKLIEGIDRENYESLNINGSQMYGFSSDRLNAKSKMIVNLEFVMYAPYKLIGFQFAPVLFYGFAGLGNNFGSIFSNTFYQAFALGVLIRNEYLVSNTFEISIGLYPYMPGNSDYTLKGNPIGSYDIKANDYFITKPDLVSYK